MYIAVQSETSGSSYIRELRNILEDKWGKFSLFEEEKNGVISPRPIVAIENSDLLGGLVFSVWPSPETGEMSVWINGLIVKPEFRRKGVATKLIQKAVEVNSLLYVKTDIEDLYKNIGWVVVSEDGSDKILKFINSDYIDRKGNNK